MPAHTRSSHYREGFARCLNGASSTQQEGFCTQELQRAFQLAADSTDVLEAPVYDDGLYL